ncbi:hypothetical protein [Nodularia sp. NIES-3585]|uniref:hypothetical protein n=1 Tax=Nodularia sp. NIES-3585 TaxID=1973477 RepID=UPI000B5CB39A|nr:hypothetical protein [Nodularia sp. NIES-3585]GAX35237.1 hypothetical protein NIES3585_12440 [Nodularia sp. NIES-3585]
MVIKSTPSINRQVSYTNKIPKPLEALLNKIRLEHYEELYEPEADGTASLEDTLNEVLGTLRSTNKTLSHLRYVWMALILALVVEPTVKYYQPHGNISPKNIINLMVKWIIETINKSIVSENSTEISVDKLIAKITGNFDFYFPIEIASLQVINEALDVFRNAVRVLDYNQSVEAILEILDDCLEGYAIFPGSYGRRELFEWWLFDVVPASFDLKPPKSFYVVEGLQNKETIRFRQTSLMNDISYLLQYITNEDKKQSQHLFYYNNIAKDKEINIEFKGSSFNSIINTRNDKKITQFV